MRWLFFLVFLNGCASRPPEYSRPALASQILHPRPGYKGLTSSTCKYDDKGKCVLDIFDYDLNDKEVRKELRDLGFICRIQGRIYRIAQEIPGLIWEKYDQSCFLMFCGSRKVIDQDVILISEYQRLLNAETVCYSWQKYGEEEL